MFHRRQGGFTLVELMLVAIVVTLLATYGLWAAVRQSDDLAAQATAQYLKRVRAATVEALSRHYEAFHEIDTTNAPPGIYEPAPAWTEFAGETHTISLQPLFDDGFLPSGFAATPRLGGSAHITFHRSGTCPGSSCNVEAYIWTCQPIDATRSRSDTVPADCTVPAHRTDGFDPALVAKILEESEGLGAGNFFDSTLRGSLYSVDNATLGAPETLGRVALIASLNQTHLNQFVRQGDTRHIHLRNALTVEGQVASRTGLLLETVVTPAMGCDAPGLLARSENGVLAQCVGAAGAGSWIELTRHVVARQGLYSHGDVIPSPSCPAEAVPFVQVASATMDFTIPGADISVRGDLAGEVTGSGTVSGGGGPVTISGAVTGELMSRLDSEIQVRQSVTALGPTSGPWTVNISPADPGARVLAVSGCTLG